MNGTVIVTGTRKLDARGRSIVWDVLDRLDPAVVVHGGASGADTLAHLWCKERGRVAKVYFPDWSTGKGAALRRNAQMLEDHPDADCVAAFPAKDSRGTWHTVNEAQRRGIHVEIGVTKL